MLVLILSWRMVSDANLRPCSTNFTKPQFIVLNEYHNCVNRLIFSAPVITAGENILPFIDFYQVEIHFLYPVLNHITGVVCIVC